MRQKFFLLFFLYKVEIAVAVVKPNFPVIGKKIKDPENYEEGAIHFRYKDNDGTGSVYVKLYLYLPQGRELKADNFIIIGIG